jgi:peptide chain release factor 1
LPSTVSSLPGGVFDVELLESRPGFVVFQVIGKRAEETFCNESGGHRWQRVPVNHGRGQVHTSTVTVAVLPVPQATQIVLREADLHEQTCRGSGAGGQHRNVTDTAVQLRHIPTGITVRCEVGRSQAQNREIARAALRAKLWQAEQERVSDARAADRREQVGKGMRGDKRRTIRVRDDVVNDHVTGKQWKYSDYVRGIW